MRFLIKTIVFISLLPHVGLAQHNGTTYIGLNYSADLSYRTLHVVNKDFDWIKEIRNSEVPIVAFSAGLLMEHQFEKPFNISTGLQFHQFGERITNIIGIGVNNSQFKYTYTYNYVAVPIKGDYRMQLSNGLDMTLGLGAELNVFVFTNNKYVIAENGQVVDRGGAIDTNPSPSFNKFNLVGLANIGFNYKITERIKFLVEPTFRYFVNTINNTAIRQRPFSLGLNMGLKLALN